MFATLFCPSVVSAHKKITAQKKRGRKMCCALRVSSPSPQSKGRRNVDMLGREEKVKAEENETGKVSRERDEEKVKC